MRTLLQRLDFLLRIIWATAKKDLLIAFTERIFTIVGVFLPVNVLILMSLFALSGGQAPTVVVMEDDGPYAQQFYAAMSHAHSFRLERANQAEAAALLETGKVVAVVTIPRDFDSRVRQHLPVQVEVQINNLNTDYTNDIRRAVPLSITSFYAGAFPHLVTVAPKESDLYAQDTDYIPYLTVSVMVIAIMVGGLLQAGIAAAREWEHETMKELLLAPAPRWAVQVGKMLGAYLLSLASVAVVLAVLIVFVGLRPAHWGEVIGSTLLILVIFIAVGTLLGTLVKQRQALAVLAIGLALPLFFLSGAFGPISFDPVPAQVIARAFPVYYAIVLEQHAFHDFTLDPSGLSTSVFVLCGYMVLTIALAAFVLHRAAVQH
jgi:ABC-2 type transport system permease protein